MNMTEYETNYYLDEVVNRDETELDEMMTDIRDGWKETQLLDESCFCFFE
jgi:hypothetical protein